MKEVYRGPKLREVMRRRSWRAAGATVMALLVAPPLVMRATADTAPEHRVVATASANEYAVNDGVLESVNTPADNTSLAQAIRRPNAPYQIIAAPKPTAIPGSVEFDLMDTFDQVNGCSGAEISEDVVLSAFHCMPYSGTSNQVDMSRLLIFPGGRSSGEEPIHPTSVVLFPGSDSALIVLNGRSPQAAIDEYFASIEMGRQSLEAGEVLYFAGIPPGYEQSVKNTQPVAFNMALLSDQTVEQTVRFSPTVTRTFDGILLGVENLTQDGLGCISGSSGAVVKDGQGNIVGVLMSYSPISAGRTTVYADPLRPTSSDSAVKNIQTTADLVHMYPSGDLVCGVAAADTEDSYMILWPSL